MARRAGGIIGVSVGAAAIVLGACSGGGSTAATSTTAAATTVAPTSTSESTTTTTASTTSAAPTTTIDARPRYPLTGLLVTNPATAARPALVVKVDNIGDARPQSGFNQADVVYEEIVEGVTRLAVVFQSNDAQPVGPIRSARTSDIDILAGLGRPLLAWSGGNPYVTNAIRRAPIIDVGASAAYGAVGYYRDNGRVAPHNLYAPDTARLFALAPAGSAPPPPFFTFRTDQPVGGDAVAGAKLSMLATHVMWLWDPAVGGWRRFQDGAPIFSDVRPDVDRTGVQAIAANVIVQFVGYRNSPADARSPEAITVGGGEAWVLTGGKLVRGTWSRPDRSKPAVYLDATGVPIPVTPGQTWIELAQRNTASVIPAGADPASVPFPHS